MQTRRKKTAARSKTTKLNDAEQSQRFKEMARELSSDERPEAFDALVKRVAPNKPQKR